MDAAYAHCRRVHRRHDPTYYWATRRLPPDVRLAVHALYAFVRAADEIVDGPGRAADPALRRAELDRYEQRLHDALAGEPSRDPAIAALVDAGGRHQLPLGLLDSYFDSMRIDCAPVRMASWTELESYMQGSAGAVGRILAVLLGAPADRHDAFASLALAFQLTNFIRDVREDWELDRVYLPGVSPEQIAQRRPTDGFRRLLEVEVARARDLFRQGAGAADVVTPRVQRGMSMARSVYLSVLDRTERLDFDVLHRRVSLPPWELAGAVAHGLRAGT
ncbi:MAG: 15-cis-phytoene synthase [Thermoleophilaceae bacterium]|jgi:phytoene synthase|nr:15-cis-phytoene synthase [Thermoleophilaceae bacterium]